MNPQHILKGCLISLVLIVLSTCILSTVGLATVMRSIVA